MTAPTLPGERPALRALLPAPLLTAVLAAVAVGGAVAAAPDSARVPLACGAGAGAVLLTVAVAVATHALLTAQATRRRLEAVTQDAGRLLQDRARQSAEFDRERVQLTEELTHERARRTAELAQERARLTAEFEQERARLTAAFTEERTRLTEEHTAERDRLTEEHAAERDRLTADNTRLAEQARRAAHERAVAVSATANAAGRMQALTTGMLADLRAMEERHSDEDVLADLLHLDHRTAQAGRLADSVAVLAGARSGRRWARPIAMESILRGAMGRISGYQRVRVHSACEAAVAGHAAEGVMHALAELLDNAANFSPPTAEVHVYVEEVPAGVIVSVEDSGLVMGEVQLRRAERAVSGDTEDLGGLTGTRLGLAVVGRLARKYGLKVSYRPSARGGTGVLMLVPLDILVPKDAARPQGPLTLPRPPAQETRGADEAAGARADTETGDTGSTDAAVDTGGTGDRRQDGSDESDDAHHATAAPDQDTRDDALPGHESADRGAGPRPEQPTDRLSDTLSGSASGAPSGELFAFGTVSDRHAEGGSDGLPDGLPKRRRGQALAAAERERARARARAADADRARARADEAPATHDVPSTRHAPSTRDVPAAFDTPTALDDPLTRAARFSSFRRAVHGSLSDQGGPVQQAAPATDTPEPATPRSPSHPEGDPTS
ncbi:sensor histidine kinase [Streptomyces sp. 7R007]